MAVAATYMMLNIAGVLGYAFYIVYCSIIFSRYEREKLVYLSYILIGVVLVAGINITFDGLLLKGIQKTKRKLVLAWVIWYGIFTTLVSLGWLGGFIAFLYLVAMYPSDLALGVFFACVHCLLGLVFLPVMWFCFSRVGLHLSTLAPGDDNVLISQLVRQNTRFGLVNLPPHEGDSHDRRPEPQHK